MSDTNGNDDPKPIDLGKVRQQRVERQNQEGTSVDPASGMSVFPSSGPERLSETEAYIVAEEIIGKYSQKGALIADFNKREGTSDVLGSDESTTDDTASRVEQSLESQRTWAAASSTESLVSVLSSHKTNPDLHFGTLLLAYAEEYLGRFPPKK